MNKFEYTSDIDDMGRTVVENAFINHYMPKARGDYVKVYLYGLKCCFSTEGSRTDNAAISQALKIKEEEVAKAWQYWEDEGLITLQENKNSTTFSFCGVSAMLLSSGGIAPAKRPKRSIDKKLKQMFSQIETILARPLSHNEQHIILDWIDIYHFSAQTVLLLIEDCVKREKTTIQYWDTTANVYYDMGITTYDQAREYIDKRTENNKRNKEVMNYLGMYGLPSQPQRDMLDKWFDEYGMDMKTVKKACDETLSASKPTFKYVDSILLAWHEGKQTPENNTGIKKSTGSKKTRLENEHNYDVELLEKALYEDKD